MQWVNKEVIYFDYNVFVNYIQNKEVYTHLNDMKEKYTYVYSPAYLEEVANIKMDDEEIFNHLNKISELFDNLELLPTIDDGIVARSEKPRDCFDRVYKGMGSTGTAEQLNNKFLSQKVFFNTIRSEKIFKQLKSTIQVRIKYFWIQGFRKL